MVVNILLVLCFLLQSKLLAIPSENGPRSVQQVERKNDKEPQVQKDSKSTKGKKCALGKSRNVAIVPTTDRKPLPVTPIIEVTWGTGWFVFQYNCQRNILEADDMIFFRTERKIVNSAAPFERSSQYL